MDASSDVGKARGASRSFAKTLSALETWGQDTIRAYDLKIAEKGEGGREAGGPGEFLLDPGGTVRWRKLTEIRPPEIIKAATVPR